MPHSPEDKKRAITRLRRIKGQVEALERAIQAGVECAPLLQQIVAMRGAANGLMAEVLESQLRETFSPRIEAFESEYEEDMEGIRKILRTYLR
jgi:DNA-binding FrmR family transcriptional regulator|tara:strand:- start:46457 stop:46735 length:279 start_codon:yes stop_codon:yes gene_type:complete